jgi:hypothetical protein
MPLHLEDHLDAARFSGLPAPGVSDTRVPTPVEWRFDQPQPDWKHARLAGSPAVASVVERTTDALRVTLSEGPRRPDGTNHGSAIHVDLPGWRREDWA